jgi:hypothetical protein
VLHTYTTDKQATELLQSLAIKSPNDKGFYLERGLIKHQGRLYIGENLALQTKLISSLHDSAVGGIQGSKPLISVSSNYTTGHGSRW